MGLAWDHDTYNVSLAVILYLVESPHFHAQVSLLFGVTLSAHACDCRAHSIRNNKGQCYGVPTLRYFVTNVIIGSGEG